MLAVSNGKWRRGRHASSINRLQGTGTAAGRSSGHKQIRSTQQSYRCAGNRNRRTEYRRRGEVHRNHTGCGATALGATIQDKSLRLTGIEDGSKRLVEFRSGNSRNRLACYINDKEPAFVRRIQRIRVVDKCKQLGAIGTENQPRHRGDGEGYERSIGSAHPVNQAYIPDGSVDIFSVLTYGHIHDPVRGSS